jgi:hypothetical protein
MEGDQNPPPRRMGKGGENRLIGVGSRGLVHIRYLA